jgi:hypothetical protein
MPHPLTKFFKLMGHSKAEFVGREVFNPFQEFVKISIVQFLFFNILLVIIPIWADRPVAGV